jgi:adenosylhomocysteine nucleosidase
MRIVLFSAFPQEIRYIVRGLRASMCVRLPFTTYAARFSSHDISIVLTGMGIRSVEAAMAYAFKEHRPDVVISAGFGGALYPGIGAGELVAASKIYLLSSSAFERKDTFSSGHDVHICETTAGYTFFRGLYDRAEIREGSIVTLRNWMRKEDVRAMLPRDLLLPVCDMETFPLARYTQQAGIPFLALRSITDCSDEDIPEELLSVSDASGAYRFSRAVRLLLGKPRLIPRSMKLGIRSTIASRRMGEAVKTILTAVTSDQ